MDQGLSGGSGSVSCPGHDPPDRLRIRSVRFGDVLRTDALAEHPVRPALVQQDEGVAIPAHQVMIFSVYGVDEALVTVRLQASFSEDGMTFGKSVRKSMATTAATVIPENANDQPSRPAAIVATAATSATTAMIIASRLQPSPLSSWVQIRKPSASTAVTIPSFSASLPPAPGCPRPS